MTLAAQVVRVQPVVAHKARAALMKKAQKKFAIELLRIRKHQDHLKAHIKKQLAILKEKKITFQKVRDSTLNEKKQAAKEVADIAANIRILDLAPAKARLEATKQKLDRKVADQKVNEAIKKSIAEKFKLNHKMTKKNLIVERIAKRLMKYQKKYANVTRNYKRLEYKQKRLFAKIASTAKDIEIKKNHYIKRAMRQLERKARVHAIKHYIKKIERRLDRVENEAERKKLINKQKTAVLMLTKIRARVRIHKVRKAQRKARWVKIVKTIKNMNHYKKSSAYDQKLRALEVRKAVAAVNAIQKNINTLIRNAKKTGKIDTLEMTKLNDKKNVAMSILEKAKDKFELMHEKIEMRLRLYNLRINRMKIADAKIRIGEHQLSKDAAKATRKQFMTRIRKLRALQKRMGLCPLNRLRIKRRLRFYKKEVKIATRKIRRNNKRIHVLKIRIMSIERRIRRIQKRRIAKIVIKLTHMKNKLTDVRHKIMAVRIKKDSRNKDILMVKVRTLQNIEQQLKNTIKRYMKRNGHVIRKLERLRRDELEASKKYYKDKKRFLKRISKKIMRLGRRVRWFKRKVAQLRTSPFKQIRVIRMMRRSVRRLNKLISKKKEMILRKKTAYSRYVNLRTKAVNRLHVKRSELSAKQAWILSELKTLARRERATALQIKKTTGLREMKALYKELSFIRKEGKRLQKSLYRAVKRTKKINQVFLRHNQYTAIRRAKVAFKRYNKKFVAFEYKKKALKNKMAVYQAQQAELFKKQPYIKTIAGKAKWNTNMKFVKQSISDIEADFVTLQKQEKRTIHRAMTLSKEYLNLLKVKLGDLKVRLQHKQTERPLVSKASLYSIDSAKQTRAVRRLKVIDSYISELDNTIEKTVRKIKKTQYRIGKLKAALRPEGKKCTKQTDCKICRKLGKVAKYGLVHHETDSIILNRLRGVCTRIEASRQKECYHQAMNMAMKALHTFDPEKFVVSEVCAALGKC
jgi:hypothetical protein